MPTSAKDIIQALNLQPHPEGGHYIQTFVDPITHTTPKGAQRPHSTCIYYMLQKGERSHWHKVDAVEIWHYYAGAPLTLSLWKEDEDPKEVREVVLGPDVLGGERPQGIVMKGEWQSTVSRGEWSLVGCTVAPGFEFKGWVMAEDGWKPGDKLPAGESK